MNQEELYDALDASRERLLMALEPLPDEALTYPGVLGHWSVCDLLAHLATWEAELVTALMQVRQGKKPQRLLQALADRDAYNAARYEENKDRDLEWVFADFQGARAQLEQWLEDFSDRALNDPRRYKWFDKPLWEIIADVTFRHEAAHAAAVEAFARDWQAARVDLGSIEVNE
ncbi:MAG: ClbS/DfsB family four-helix bundle protein [Ardenticatenales bacterium]|nr:ClbS/DfsB family four-helix bundle protein [Ardenticatenales bacterium]